MRTPLLFLLAFALPAAAQEPAYLDDRSDGPALIRSYYNAVNRQEYARAFAYFGDAPPAADYTTFASGYADTRKVELRLGPDSVDADMGGVDHFVGVVIGATRSDGATAVFTGCYTLRQTAWWKSDPPVFVPLRIKTASLTASEDSFEAARIPDKCIQ